MERDDQILRHIGRYHLSIRGAIEKLFFNGGSSDHVMQRLLKDGRLQVVKGAIPGGLSYYQLSLSEARRLGVPDNRAREDKTRVLRKNLGILCFCCLSGDQRTEARSSGVSEARRRARAIQSARGGTPRRRKHDFQALPASARNQG